MNEKDETPSTVYWRYRYLFRGVGWVVVAGSPDLACLFYRTGARPLRRRAFAFVLRFAVRLVGANNGKAPMRPNKSNRYRNRLGSAPGGGKAGRGQPPVQGHRNQEITRVLKMGNKQTQKEQTERNQPSKGETQK